MNYGMIAYVLGWILSMEAMLLVPAGITAIVYREKEGLAILITILICLIPGVIRLFVKPRKKQIYAKEGLVITSLSWLLLSLFGALPFRISGHIPHMVDAVFETASGFTTTGASILTDVEALPHCLLFWRSFTHWVGGMGILVFLIAVLPMAGNGSDMFLMKAESPGPSIKKIVPKVKGTASTLYAMYVVITVVEFILLVLGRMPIFDSLVLTFGTAGTGGFGVRNDSIGSYTTYQQVVITIFMILFGINFSAYFLLYKRRFREILGMKEVLVYLGIILCATTLISINIAPMYTSKGMAVKDAAFQVGSIITTTGYSTTDFNLWPSFSKTILVTLMFIGACAGSTGGGIKVSRIIILIKTVFKELDYVVHPNNVRKIKVDGKQLEHTVLRSVNVFMASYIIIFVGSLLIVSLDGFDYESSFTAIAATLNNIGPGLGVPGPASNFSMFSNLSKIVMTFDMIAGRLELFPVLILFSRRTWKR